MYVEIVTNNNANLAVLFYSGSDLVSLNCLDQADGSISGTMCVMKTASFFRYLNAIPNMYLYADLEHPMANATPEGIFLLSELAAMN